MRIQNHSDRNANRRARGRRGFVLITMAATSIAMLGAMGLAVDLGRVFIVKNEAQAYADAEALSAALQLDGTSTGITNAINAVTSSSNTFNFSSTDKWNFNTCSELTSTAACTSTTPTVEFATASTGATWYTTAAAITGAGISLSSIDTTRVTTSVSVPLYFLPVVMTTKVFTTNVKGQAVAGQVAITNMTQGLAPFTAVATSTTGPNFGLTPGSLYDIQWPQFNGNRKNCSNGQPDNCFVQPTCTDESNAAKQEVVNAWSSSTNGYWGSNSASTISSYILGTQQLAAVAVGADLTPDLSPGNKASTAKALDDRVNSDPVNYGNDYSTYASTSGHNGRRLIVVPMVLPATHGNSSTNIVQGYGEFFLQSDTSSSGGSSGYYKAVNGNDPYCAVYVGPFNLGSLNGGSSGSSSGASRVRLLQ
jgi:hypothetical protein